MTFNKVLVVKGENPKQMGKLFEMTETDRPDLVILMGDFYYPEEISRLKNQAMEMSSSFSYFVEMMVNDEKRELVNRAITSATAWIETISHLNNIGCYVFVLGHDFPIFYKDRDVKRSLNFGRLMGRSLDRKSLHRKWRYFDDIDVINIADLSMVFWQKDAFYQDQLFCYKTDLRTVLVTDGEPSLFQKNMVTPWRIISPFTAEHCSLK